jgi:hypothetical protein
MSESIYNLIPQPVPMPEKEPLYRSSHAAALPPTFSTFGLTGTSKPGYANVGGAGAIDGGHYTYKKSFATMGKEGNAAAPNDILKGKTGGGGGAYDAAMGFSQQTGVFQYGDRRVPPLPSKDELAEVKRMSVAVKKAEPKNFVTSNAVENILAVPKREPEAMNWLKKPHFGEMPPYLVKIKQEISDEYEYIKSMQQQQSEDMAPPGMKVFPDEERVALVNSLKSKWQDVNRAYQGSSVLSLQSLDTIGKVKRKEMYEAQLAQIEKDIEKLSKKTVYVKDDGF